MEAKLYPVKTGTLFAILILMLSLAPFGKSWGQPWTYNFGTGTGSHTSGSSSSFLPAPSSGSTYVRIGSGAGSINLDNPGLSSLGTATELRAVAPTGTSVNKASIYDYTAGKVGYLKFSTLLGNITGGTTATTGTWYLFIGDGSTFSDGSSFNGAQTFTGLRWVFGTSGTITTTYRNGSSWSSLGSTPFAQGNVYTVEIFYNNSTSSQTYTRGSAQSIAANKLDIWVNGSLIGDDLAKAQLANDANIDSWMFYGESSTSNVANLFVDDVEYSNALPTGNTVPTVTTQAASSILTTTATGNGNITATGGVNPTERGFCWDLATNADPDIDDSHTTESGSFSTGAFTGSITGLTAGTQYKVRAYATNSVGTGYGSVVTFYTLSLEPTAYPLDFTAAAASLSQITLNFSASSTITYGAGYIILRKTGSAPTGLPVDATSYSVGNTIGDATVAAIVTNTSATSASITGLTAGTTYYFTIFPYNWNGTNAATYNYKSDNTPLGCNAIVAFVPTVTTQAASSILTTTATGNGNITATGGVNPTDRGFCWDLAANADPDLADSHTTESGSFSTGAFTGSITGLSAETQYKMRAYANNIVGASYGSAVTFYTLSTEPGAYPATFTATPFNDTRIDLAFNAANTIANADGYIILMKSGSAPAEVPADANAYSAGNSIGTSTVAAVISDISAISASITGLNGGTTYYFTIFPYNWDASNAPTYNYKTDNTAPGCNATTPLPATITTTITATSITPSSASSGGTGLNGNGYSISDKGVCYNTTGTPTISDAKNSAGTGTSDFAVTLTPLSAETHYYARAYASNAIGTGYASQINFYTLSEEPTGPASNLTVTLTATTTQYITWTAASFPTSGATNTGYLLLRAVSPNVPGLNNYDGYSPSADGNTVIAANLGSGATSYTATGLSACNNYTYRLIPYCYGSNNATYNYREYDAPTSTLATPCALSDVLAAGGESATISSLENDPAPLSSSDGAQVWQFTIRDGGASMNDSDALPTIVTGITLAQASGNAVDNWAEAIKTISLFDGSTNIGTATVSATQIVFSGLSINVADNNSKTITMRLSLNAPLNNSGTGNLDGDDFVFSLSSANFTTLTDGTSSLKSTFSAQTSTNGQNVLSVVATQLNFKQQPTNTNVDVVMSPAVTVAGTDIHGNIDRSYNATITILSTGTLSGTSTTVSITTSGVATFNNLVHTTEGTHFYLTATTAGYNDVNSNEFDITGFSGTFWDGGAGTINWNDANNWSNNVIPGINDKVKLDNSYISGSYSVVLPSGNTQTVIKQLIIAPIQSNSITLTLPYLNTYGSSSTDAGFIIGDGTKDNYDVIVYEGGILENNTGAASGKGIKVAASADSVRINNGGKYYHKTDRSASGIVDYLSKATGTEHGIVEYDRPGNGQWNFPSSGNTYGDLVLSNSSGTTSYASNGASALTIRGDLKINDNVTYSFQEGATLPVNLKGDLIFNGSGLTFQSGQSVNFNGTTEQNISGNKVIVFACPVNINEGSHVNIPPNVNVTLNGTLTNNAGSDGLIIKSDATGTGSLIHNTSNVQATIQRYITGNTDIYLYKYHFVSIPLTPANNSLSGLFYDSYLWDFDETVNNWRAWGTPTTTVLDETRGYIIYYRFAEFTYEFPGPMNNGNFSANVTFTEQGAPENEGWNLVPNPYPSGIDWDLVTQSDRPNIEGCIYFWPSNAGTGGSSTYYYYVGGLSNPELALDGTIPIGQSFMAHANGGTPSLTFKNSHRVHSSQTYLKKSNDIHDVLYLTASDSIKSDQTAIRFLASATENFDGEWDAYKFLGGQHTLNICSISADGFKLAINSLPSENKDIIIPIYFYYTDSAKITIKASNLQSFDTVFPIYFEDKLLDKRVNLWDEDYTFEHHGDTVIDRFQIRFNITYGIDEKNLVDGRAFMLNGKLNIDIPEFENKKVSLQVLDLTGKTVLSGSMKLNGNTQTDLQAATGYYIVRVTDGRKQFVSKLLVH